MSLKMNLDDLRAFLARDFGQVAEDFEILDVAPMHLVLRAHVHDRHLRPGGTVSGPTMFALADVGVYLAILAMVGPKALAVTTNCSIDFMRKPVAEANLRGDVRLLKLGRVLAVGDVLIYSEGEEQPVARASLTYSIPPER
ncbi:PaaI family thioesterase [Sinisalibacter lacisalsi]|uniref:Thioesterase n=1 Tax=Sinisalibacter lacisalsi TaxID=1526570 RepID=A0ABQ1QMX5_9RHOB|nr:PaaI family thioesterase [Sinisalibacter lacisalsi]GGD33271.1 thioesterase [Sinisalibacter lacisalsi]